MDELTVPNEAFKYILFQRTEYLRFPKTFAFRKLRKILPFSIYEPLVTVEAKLRQPRIKALYEEDMGREFLTIREALPPRCASVLDIGCGVAGIDVWLNRHYEHDRPVFHLLDKTKLEQKVYYGFESAGAFYNSLQVARAMLVSNGIPQGRIHLMEATDTCEIPVDGPVDLVVSLISWGFHYPIETYLTRVHELLSSDGRLIVDLRRGTNGVEALRRAFGRVAVIREAEKFQRVVAVK